MLEFWGSDFTDGCAVTAIVHWIARGCFCRLLGLESLLAGISRRHEGCSVQGMVATNHEQLFAWKLSAQLRDAIVALTAHGPAARDFKFRDQIRDSSASAASNLSEGFYRFNPKEFAYFTNVARSSLGETKNHLGDGLKRKYFSPDEYRRLFNLASWAMGTTTNLHTYLLSCVAKGKKWRPGSCELPD
jgi:four helix bundle protein